MTRKIKLRYMAVLIACILMLPFAGVIAHAGSTGAKEQKKTQDEVQLTEKNGKIEVSLGMDRAYKEQMTAVSLTLRIDVKNGKEKVSFSFPKELQDAVTGSRYKDGYLYLYAANDSGIFDKNDKLVLGNLKVEADSTDKGVNAVVCYVEDSLKAVNAAYGDRVVKNAAYSTAITVNKVAKKEEQSAGSDKSDAADGSGENADTDHSGNTGKPGSSNSSNVSKGEQNSSNNGNSSNNSNSNNSSKTDKNKADAVIDKNKKKEDSLNKKQSSDEEESLEGEVTTDTNGGDVSSDEEKMESSSKLEKEKDNQVLYLIIAAAIILLIAGILLWRKKKANKSE